MVMRTYYCKPCQESITFKKNEIFKCNNCGNLFGNYKKNPFEINMRKTWSGTTKIEFSTQTMDESVKEMTSGRKF
jgi:ribosomal protein L37AE/L43A